MAWAVKPFAIADIRRRDTAVEHLGVRLVADGVDVRAAMLHADDHPGGAATHPQLIGAVVIAVPAMEEIGVARLVGGDDRHALKARLLQIEHAHLLVDQRERDGRLMEGRPGGIVAVAGGRGWRRGLQGADQLAAPTPVLGWHIMDDDVDPLQRRAADAMHEPRNFRDKLLLLRQRAPFQPTDGDHRH